MDQQNTGASSSIPAIEITKDGTNNNNDMTYVCEDIEYMEIDRRRNSSSTHQHKQQIQQVRVR